MRYSILLLIAVLFAGCASMGMPSAGLIDEKPVVQLGGEAPEDNDYVLHVPAGREFPVKLSVDGSLFEHCGVAETRMSFKRDIYLYKYYASYDGREWMRLNDLFGLTFSAGMNTEGGKVEVVLDQRP